MKNKWHNGPSAFEELDSQEAERKRKREKRWQKKFEQRKKRRHE